MEKARLRQEQIDAQRQKNEMLKEQLRMGGTAGEPGEEDGAGGMAPPRKRAKGPEEPPAEADPITKAQMEDIFGSDDDEDGGAAAVGREGGPAGVGEGDV